MLFAGDYTHSLYLHLIRFNVRKGIVGEDMFRIKKAEKIPKDDVMFHTLLCSLFELDRLIMRRFIDKNRKSKALYLEMKAISSKSV